MLSLRTYLLFIATALAIIAAPGPDIFYVLSRAISGGRRVGSYSACGVAVGEVVHTLLAVCGLAALLRASIAAFLFLKYVGAVYLICLGVRAFRERSAMALTQLDWVSQWRAFRQGMLTNLFNPKAVMFYVSFLPQFVDPAHGLVTLQLIELGLTFAFLDVIFLNLLAHGAGRIGAWLLRSPQNASRIRWGTGTLLVGLGVRLALTNRN